MSDRGVSSGIPPLDERPRLLDLFSGAGGAAKGYQRAGFYVVGVDIEPQPNYCGDEFIQADALTLPLKRVAAIHASPPCQGYTQLAAVNAKLGRAQRHAKLIEDTRALLIATGLPYVIENVVGAPLLDPVRVCGTSFGLPLRRHRLFESNVYLEGTACEHRHFTERRYWTGWRPNGEHRLSTVVQVYGNAADKHEWPDAMGIDWMTYDELAEAIPPAYTEHIGQFLMAAVEAEKAKAAA
jgi:DNA (cytosine-5)-methyltransferase 1